MGRGRRDRIGADQAARDEDPGDRDWHDERSARRAHRSPAASQLAPSDAHSGP